MKGLLKVYFSLNLFPQRSQLIRNAIGKDRTDSARVCILWEGLVRNGHAVVQHCIGHCYYWALNINVASRYRYLLPRKTGLFENTMVAWAFHNHCKVSDCKVSVNMTINQSTVDCFVFVTLKNQPEYCPLFHCLYSHSSSRHAKRPSSPWNPSAEESLYWFLPPDQ